MSILEKIILYPYKKEIRISRSYAICSIDSDDIDTTKPPIIVIKGPGENLNEEIIILDGHHRSYVKKNCYENPTDKVIIVHSRPGKLATKTAENGLDDLSHNNDTSTDFFPGFAFG